MKVNNLFNTRLGTSLFIISIILFGFNHCKNESDDNSALSLLALSGVSNSNNSSSNSSNTTTNFSIGGSITGLSVSGLVLQNNSGDDLSVSE